MERDETARGRIPCRQIKVLVEHVLETAPNLRLLFVTNIRSGELADLGEDGVQNSAQYYTQEEADGMIRSLEGLGLTVEPFYSETALFEALLRDDGEDDRQKLVYTTAEGGTGSGRRAMIPALCKLLGVPVMNSGAHASTLVRHKYHAYTVLRSVGVRVPQTWQFADDGWTGGLAPPPGSRVIVKPTYESMGIGVDDESVQVVDVGFEAFVAERVQQFGQPAVVQEFVTGDEVGVPVARLGRTFALPPISQDRTNGERYGSRPKTFRDEHIEKDLSHAPFRAPATQIEAMSAAAILAFDALEMRGVGRIDFRVDADGRAWAFDTNGEPPPLAKTCWGVAMESLGFGYRDLLALWIGICLFDHDLVSGVGPEGELAAGK